MTDELIRPTRNGGEQTPSSSSQESKEPKTAKELWSQAYQGKEPAAAQATLKKLEAAKGGLSAWDGFQDYYKGAAQADRDAEEKERTQVLTDEELEGDPDEVRDIYNKYLSQVFELEGVKVTRKDPEWMYIQAELDDPTGSLALTMIAAQEAASRKKQRLQGMSRIEIRDNMYKPE